MVRTRFQCRQPSITLADKGFETVRIGLSSMEGQLYEGRIVVTVIVNGAEKKLGVGCAAGTAQMDAV